MLRNNHDAIVTYGQYVSLVFHLSISFAPFLPLIKSELIRLPIELTRAAAAAALYFYWASIDSRQTNTNFVLSFLFFKYSSIRNLKLHKCQICYDDKNLSWIKMCGGEKDPISEGKCLAFGKEKEKSISFHNVWMCVLKGGRGRNKWKILFYLFSIYVPLKIRRRFWFSRCAVNINRVVDPITLKFQSIITGIFCIKSFYSKMSHESLNFWGKG